ncbi:MAG: 3-dehydroquinate synthase [Clostridia bacterium]|jgi:3-dehydroquinate synthase|nr:3-dehydroquinate synthase [Clostridia bacterium]
MKSITVKTAQNEYILSVGRGFKHKIAGLLKETYPKSKFAIITDDNVSALYEKEIAKTFDELDLRYDVITIKPGEKSKSMSVFSDINSFLAQKNYNRADVIVALGGGVVGDLAGFVASAYLRGISFVQIPTTLLAQIDSSVGGKTAINIPEGKNLVGAFYQPSAVYIDMDFLTTLKSVDFADGMAELIKYAAIKDAQMFETLEESDKIDANSEILEELIVRCLQIKRDVVIEDELDRGERMKLNYGHTIGHGLERMCAKSGRHITHGQGVARGMAAITAASEALGQTLPGTTERIIAVLKKQELPTDIDGFDKDEILQGILVDKKNMAEMLNIILIDEIGKVYIHEINSGEVERYLK